MLLDNCTDGVLVMLASVSSSLAAQEHAVCGVSERNKARGITPTQDNETHHTQHGFHAEGRCKDKVAREGCKCLLHTFRSQGKTWLADIANVHVGTSVGIGLVGTTHRCEQLPKSRYAGT